VSPRKRHRAIAGAALGAIVGGAELSKIINGGLPGVAAGTVILPGTGSTRTVIPSGTRMSVRSTDTIACADGYLGEVLSNSRIR
jgi:hypothetical protein